MWHEVARSDRRRLAGSGSCLCSTLHEHGCERNGIGSSSPHWKASIPVWQRPGWLISLPLATSFRFLLSAVTTSGVSPACLHSGLGSVQCSPPVYGGAGQWPAVGEQLTTTTSSSSSPGRQAAVAIPSCEIVLFPAKAAMRVSVK